MVSVALPPAPKVEKTPPKPRPKPQKPPLSLVMTFKKSKVMFRLNLLQFLEPSEWVKLSLVCKTLHFVIDENQALMKFGQITPSLLTDVRLAIRTKMAERDGLD